MVAGQIAPLTVALVVDVRYLASRFSVAHHRLFELARSWGCVH
jgi:hypothetical protein